MKRLKKSEKSTGLALASELLEQKIQDYASGLCDLSTQDLLKIHEALSRDRPTGEFIFMTLVNLLEYLDTVYQADSDVKQEIESFVYAFKSYIRAELSQSTRTRAEADKIL